MKSSSKKKLSLSILSFLLLVPFRLPISVLLIKLFNSIAQLEGTKLSLEILRANVLCTKIIYNLFFSAIMVYSIEIMSRDIKGRKSNEPLYWWTATLIALLFVYNCFDGYWIVELFNLISK